MPPEPLSTAFADPDPMHSSSDAFTDSVAHACSCFSLPAADNGEGDDVPG